MGPLAKLDKLERILSGMEQELEEIGEFLMESTEVDHMMVDMNIEQMMLGKTSEDKDIVPEYAEKTKIIKEKKGQIYDRVTLRDKEDFQGAMKVRNFKSKSEILSEDSKSEALQAKYGERIFGLNDKHMSMLRNFLQPQFEIRLRKYINS